VSFVAAATVSKRSMELLQATQAFICAQTRELRAQGRDRLPPPKHAVADLGRSRTPTHLFGPTWRFKGSCHLLYHQLGRSADDRRQGQPIMATERLSRA
jgi:hypothetical protein